MLEDFIPQLQKDLELTEPLVHDGEGSYAFLLDDQTVTISKVAEGFQLMSTLGELPLLVPELFFVKMLRGNFLGQATAGAILGLDETGTRMLLRSYCPNKGDYRAFKETLEDFINTIDFWKSQKEAHDQNPAA